jgi:hypothetical protein
VSSYRVWNAGDMCCNLCPDVPAQIPPDDSHGQGGILPRGKCCRDYATLDTDVDCFEVSTLKSEGLFLVVSAVGIMQHLIQMWIVLR